MSGRRRRVWSVRTEPQTHTGRAVLNERRGRGGEGLDPKVCVPNNSPTRGPLLPIWMRPTVDTLVWTGGGGPQGHAGQTPKARHSQPRGHCPGTSDDLAPLVMAAPPRLWAPQTPPPPRGCPASVGQAQACAQASLCDVVLPPAQTHTHTHTQPHTHALRTARQEQRKKSG